MIVVFQLVISHPSGFPSTGRWYKLAQPCSGGQQEVSRQPGMDLVGKFPTVLAGQARVPCDPWRLNKVVRLPGAELY